MRRGVTLHLKSGMHVFVLCVVTLHLEFGMHVFVLSVYCCVCACTVVYAPVLLYTVCSCTLTRQKPVQSQENNIRARPLLTLFY